MPPLADFTLTSPLYKDLKTIDVNIVINYDRADIQKRSLAQWPQESICGPPPIPLPELPLVQGGC